MIDADIDLEQRLFQLQALYEIGWECAQRDSWQDILRVLLSSAMGAFGAVGGVVFVGNSSGRLESMDARGVPNPDAWHGWHLSESVQSYLRATSEREARRRGDLWARAAGMDAWAGLTVDESTRGLVALGPRLAGSTYSTADRQLLEQIAVGTCPHLRNLKLRQQLEVVVNDLKLRVRALSVANEIASAIGGDWTVPRVHRFLLQRVVDALDAIEGALAIRAECGWRVVVRYPPATETRSDVDEQLILQCIEQGGADMPTDAREVVASIEISARQLGALWLRRAADLVPFDSGDLELLQLLSTQVGMVLENGRLFERVLLQQQEQFRTRAFLEQYVTPTVVDRLLDRETQPIVDGTRLTVSVLKADMRASTQLTVRLDPEVTLRLMNEYLAVITDVLVIHEATIDRIEGDGIVALFGAPEPRADDAVRAVRTARALHDAFARLIAGWRERVPLPAEVGMGVGVATGEVLAANIGSAKRLHYTTTGPAINLAARLADTAPAGTLQLDQQTWNFATDALRFDPRAHRRRPRMMRAKGFPALVPVYRLYLGSTGVGRRQELVR